MPIQTIINGFFFEIIFWIKILYTFTDHFNLNGDHFLNKEQNTVIAIDGPAASGKSSLGILLAKKLGFMFLDTGVMYRAVTWAVFREKIDVKNEEEVSILSESIQIDFLSSSKTDGRENDIYVNDVDVTRKLRGPMINDHVSIVASYKRVRESMTRLQQEIGAEKNIVMVGRDIGTVVMPNADIKIFLLASVEERAKRRFLQEGKKPNRLSLEQIKESIRSRDTIDSNRKYAPLKPAKDAILINTDRKSLEEVFQEVWKKITL